MIIRDLFKRLAYFLIAFALFSAGAVSFVGLMYYGLSFLQWEWIEDLSGFYFFTRVGIIIAFIVAFCFACSDDI